jgi:hypothetical protein
MLFKIFLLLFSFVAIAQPRINQDDLFIKSRGLTNYVKNSNAWWNLADVVDADGIVTRQTTGFLEGRASFQIDATAADEEVLFEIAPLSDGLLGGICEAEFKYKGDATNLEAFVRQGSTGSISDVVPLLNAASSQTFRVIVPCGADNTDTRYIVLKANGATTDVLVDSLYFGEAFSVGAVAQAYDFGSLTYAATANCIWSGASSSATPPAINEDTDCPTPSVTGRIAAPSTKIPAFVIPAGSPSGVYKIDATGTFEAARDSTSAASAFMFYDGTNYFNTQQVGIFALSSGSVSSVNRSPNLSATYTYTSSPTDTLVEIRGRLLVTGSTLYRISAVNTGLTFNVTYLPTSSQIVQRGDVTDLTGFAKSPATSNCAWTTTSGTMASFAADADCPALTVSGNAASPATKIPAFVAPNLLPGKYMVVVGGRMRASESTSGSPACNFEIYDGTNSGGVARHETSTNSGSNGSFALVGQFEYESSQSNLQFQIRAQRVNGNGNCGVIASDNDLTFTLIPLSQGLPKPFIPSSVFAGRSDISKDSFFQLNCSSSSSISSDLDVVIASIANISSGTCAVTFNTNYYVNAPLCVGTRLSNTNDRNAYLTGITSTGFTMRGVDGSTASTNFDMSIFCRASK